MLNISKPTKQEIDSQLTQVAEDLTRTMERLHNVYAYYLSVTDAELAAAPYSYGPDEVYAIRAACIAFENTQRLFHGASPLDATVPAQYVAPLVRPLVI